MAVEEGGLLWRLQYLWNLELTLWTLEWLGRPHHYQSGVKMVLSQAWHETGLQLWHVEAVSGSIAVAVVVDVVFADEVAAQI